MGVLYNEMLKKPDSAIYYIDKSIYFAKKNDNKNGICINLINKASCYYYKKENIKAIVLLEEADSIELLQNSKSIKSFIYEFLALNYNELKDYKKAYELMASEPFFPEPILSTALYPYLYLSAIHNDYLNK